MIGIQYTILADNDSPNLFVIEKGERCSIESLDKYKRISYYYVLGGNIYQSPDIYTLIITRLNSITRYINNSYLELQNYHKFNNAIGSYWSFKDKEMDEKEEYPVDKKEEDIIRNMMKGKVDQLLFSITESFTKVFI